MRYLPLLLAPLICSPAFAGNPPNTQGTQTKEIRTQCPAVSSLEKDAQTNTWYTTTDRQYWKSLNTSLVTTLESFTGAQYIGNAQGHITCVYVGSHNASAFPVIFHFGTLVHQPMNKQGLYKWAPLKNGWENCFSANPSDCSFSPVESHKITNPYSSLSTMKANKTLSSPVVSF